MDRIKSKQQSQTLTSIFGPDEEPSEDRQVSISSDDDEQENQPSPKRQGSKPSPKRQASKPSPKRRIQRKPPVAKDLSDSDEVLGPATSDSEDYDSKPSFSAKSSSAKSSSAKTVSEPTDDDVEIKKPAPKAKGKRNAPESRIFSASSTDPSPPKKAKKMEGPDFMGKARVVKNQQVAKKSAVPSRPAGRGGSRLVRKKAVSSSSEAEDVISDSDVSVVESNDSASDFSDDE
eukprot:GHVO01013106.1.p2 GENE.GHVO01013106.1~~GHVO01013106.1.p2  ORF type:complete len:232 (-),score=47.08 GHVO01013106.1:180-875(-)